MVSGRRRDLARIVSENSFSFCFLPDLAELLADFLDPILDFGKTGFQFLGQFQSALELPEPLLEVYLPFLKPFGDLLQFPEGFTNIQFFGFLWRHTETHCTSEISTARSPPHLFFVFGVSHLGYKLVSA